MISKKMRAFLYSLLPIIFLLGPSESAFALNEDFGTSGSLLTSGDWTTITGPGVILSIPSAFDLGSSNGTATGFSVNANTHTDAIINFLGNSNVAGTIGVIGGVVANVQGGAAGTSVTFNGQVASTLASFTSASTMIFNTTSAAALHFSGFNGTAILAPGITFNGAATTTAANTGIITLNNNSVYNGAIGDATNYINQINLPTGNATINGATVSQNIIVGPNTLTVTGAGLTFPAGSTFTLTASGDTTYGQIRAETAAGLSLTSGLTVDVNVPNTAVFSGSPLQVISGQGASGNTILVNSLNPRYSFTALNNSSNPAGIPGASNNVLLFPAIVSAVPASSPASGAASAFDDAAFGAVGDMLVVQGLVTALGSLEAIGAAEAQFMPIVNGGNVAMSFQALNQFQNRWASNLSNARSADMCYPTRRAPCCDEQTGCLVRDTRPVCLSSCNSACDPCGTKCKNHWNGEGVWVDGFGYFANQKTQMTIEGYDATMYGGMAAIQRPISRHWQLGLGAGYAHTNINGSGIPENGTQIDTPQATAYLGYTCGPWFVDSFATFSVNYYKSYRHIQFTGLDRTASASYNGYGFSPYISTGYNYFMRSGFTVTPLASLQYSTLKINGYTETGADSIDLIQQGQNYETLQSGLGLMVGYPIRLKCGTLYTEVHSKWLYNIKNYQIINDSRYYGGGPAFETVGVNPERQGVSAGISSTIFTRGNVALKASYEWGYRSSFVSNEAMATITYIF